MCLLPRRSTATIRPFRCWSPVSAEPELGDYGRMSATTGRPVAPHRRRQSTFTAPTAATRPVAVQAVELEARAAVTPLLDAFFVWAQNAERTLPPRSDLAEALRYIIRRRTALPRLATDARLEADNNIAENAIRGIALGRRNWLFAGSHSGGERAAAMYSILQTAKLNGVNPEAYLTDTLSKIAAGHPINRISELMPWAYQSATSDTAA